MNYLERVNVGPEALSRVHDRASQHRMRRIWVSAEGGLKFIEKLLATKLTSTDTTGRHAPVSRQPIVILSKR
jgi:hypothetical protein